MNYYNEIKNELINNEKIIVRIEVILLLIIMLVNY